MGREQTSGDGEHSFLAVPQGDNRPRYDDEQCEVWSLAEGISRGLSRSSLDVTVPFADGSC